MDDVLAKANRNVSVQPFVGCWWAILIAMLIQAYRLVTVVADNGETPFLSANDRSRWCTIAALIEDGSFQIDRLLEKRDHTGRKRTWYTIDMVRKPEVDGSEHYYSSKPPLLAVLHAAVCSPITALFQRRLSDSPLLIARCLLAIVQWLPLAIVWFLFAKWIERHLSDLWARWSMLAMLLFGTYLSTFSNTLNNHLPAALCMIVSVWLIERLFRLRSSSHSLSEDNQRKVERRNGGLCMAVGFFAGLTAAFELPGLAWAAGVIGLLFITLGWKESVASLIGMTPVAIAFGVTNYIAYGDLQPPYAHRELLGEKIASVDERISSSTEPTIDAIRNGLVKSGIEVSEPYALRSARRANTWEFSGVRKAGREDAIRFAVVPGENGWSIHRWNDWYDYPKSYWLPGKKIGVDLGEPSKLAYAFHVLVGHHGIFSLTPFWILSALGAVVYLRRWPSHGLIVRNMSEDDQRWWLSFLIVGVSCVCIAFYLNRPLIDRNYGGVCSGFRWQFWLIPAWLWLAAPVANYLGSRSWGRVLLVIFIIASIFSATYPWHNPWQHPWPYKWFVLG
jgi:uncharacterized membrane protein YfcA